MSKLKDAFRKTGKSDGPRALGFGPTTSSKQRSILVGIHTGADASGAAKGLKAGADFAVVHTDDAATAAATIAAADAGDAFFGAHVGALGEGDGEKLAESGCAFVVVVPDRTPAAETLHDDLGIVVPVDIAAEDRELQTLARLDLDAVVVPEEVGDITLLRQASLLRVAALTGRRLIARVPANTNAADLRALRDAGVGALLIPDSTSATDVKGLIERIGSIPSKKAPDEDGRSISMLPQLTSHE